MKTIKSSGMDGAGDIHLFFLRLRRRKLRRSNRLVHRQRRGHIVPRPGDAPGGDYQAVYVTVKEVRVCRVTGSCDLDDPEDCECRWETVATPRATYNLLELVNGVMATLGSKEIVAGTYNQMRLLLYEDPDDSLNLFGDPHPYPQYLIDEGGTVHAMKVPSGYQSCIKLVHVFDIAEGLTTELLLDFDVADSVVKAGNSENTC